ncbi:MAG: type II CAAX endopeptidase family protein [Termitinemataceae bacterium]|nr:MAG: type II CAAX endopeptidase family protein [Termitinemataceae bacterium]
MENKNYPKLKQAILLTLIFLGIQLVFGLIIGVLEALLNISDESIFSGILMTLTSIISFGVVILIGFKKTQEKFNDVFKFNKVSLSMWCATIIFMFGFFILSNEFDNMLNHFLPMPDILKNVFESMIVKQNIIIAIVVVAIVPALFEEMYFRGLLLNGLSKNYSQRKAIIITAIIFAIIHLNPWQSISAFVIGLFSAWICIKANSILLSIYIHLFNNSLALIFMRFPTLIPMPGFNSLSNTEKNFQPLWFDLIGVIILVVGIILLKRCFGDKNRQKAI